MVKKEHMLGIGAFLALLFLMVVLYMVSKQQVGGSIPVPGGGGTYVQHGQVYGALPVQITDPSFLPKGTSALWVTFSNASVYSQSEGWLSGGGYGPVNLAAQTNQSVTVSSVSVPYNTIISAARLGVRSAYMIINGTRYNVTIPGASITTNISGTKFSGNKTLLVDFSPFALSSAGSHNSIRLGYSSKAYILNGSGSSVGQSNRVALDTAKSVTPSANISVENVTITTSGGVTRIRVTLINHSNRSAHIGSVAVMGNENFSYNRSTIAAISSKYADAIVQKYASVQGSASGSGGASSGIGGSLISALFNTSASGASAGINSAVYTQALGFGANLTSIVYSNISALAQLAGPLPKSLLGSGGSVNVTALKSAVYSNIYGGIYNASLSSSDFQSSISSVDFTPTQSGSLEQSWGTGGSSYDLQPNSSVTFDYTGAMSLDNTTSISLVPDSNYQVVVAGDNGTSGSYEAVSGG